MATKVTVKFGDFKQLKDLVFNADKRKMTKRVREVILKRILSGFSPVKGKGRYVKYSDAYERRIRKGKGKGMRSKSVTPPNLKVTGDMLQSLKATGTKKGLEIEFTSDLAEYHNKTGPNGNKKKVRPMLPRKGQRFSDVIIKEIIIELKSILKKNKQRAKA